MNVQSQKLRLALYGTLSVYCAASLLHFVHNATYLHDYPNMPPSLSAFRVYAAWCAVTVVGIGGLWCYRRNLLAGLCLFAVYALLGFGGLDHYMLAPIDAHSMMMNLTIALEVTAASVLLAIVAVCYADIVRRRRASVATVS